MPSEAETLIRLENVDAGYGGQPVIHGVNWEIDRGQYWFVLGRNGSGKTTLLRVVLGFLEPRSGKVWRHEEHGALARIGYVPQRAALNPALPTTVREFVTLGRIGSGRPRASLSEDFSWALERVGLTELAVRDFWALSGGQRQRALVARALIRRPSLLILDEPTEGLDSESLDGLLQTLDDLQRVDGATLLVVTHRADLVSHASHVARLQNGRVTSEPA